MSTHPYNFRLPEQCPPTPTGFNITAQGRVANSGKTEPATREPHRGSTRRHVQSLSGWRVGNCTAIRGRGISLAFNGSINSLTDGNHALASGTPELVIYHTGLIEPRSPTDRVFYTTDQAMVGFWKFWHGLPSGIRLLLSIRQILFIWFAPLKSQSFLDAFVQLKRRNGSLIRQHKH